MNISISIPNSTGSSLLSCIRWWQNSFCCDLQEGPIHWGDVQQGPRILSWNPKKIQKISKLPKILNINSSLTNWTTHYRIICPSPEAAMLMKRLESQVFHAMQTADSPLYEPGLAMLLVGKKKKQKQDQNNMPLQKRHLLFVVVVILTSIWNRVFTNNDYMEWLLCWVLV